MARIESIYLDHHATTPVDPRVREAMLPFFSEDFGNVASQHICGRAVSAPVVEARAQLARLIHCEPREITFTSGATESNALAIKGLCEANEAHGRHIITCVTEHKSILATCQYLETRGYAVTYLPVDQCGCVDLAALRAAIRTGAPGTVDRTLLISIMAANNEIGTIHPSKAIVDIGHAAGVFVHIDASQAVGKIPVDVTAWDVDLLSFTAHKMYGPKGVGAVYVRKHGANQPKIAPQIHGGGQEGGLRSGTLPVPLVVGFGKACEIAADELQHEAVRLTKMRNELWQMISQKITGIRLNGHPTERLPGNVSITFCDCDGERLPLGLKEICVSSTSACSSGNPTPSYVLKAIGHTDGEAFATLRIGLGRSTEPAHLQLACDVILREVSRLRAIRPKSCTESSTDSDLPPLAKASSAT